MRKKAIKKYRASLYPLYSLQFGRFYGGVNDGVLKFRETSNIPYGTEPLRKRKDDMAYFGSCTAHSKLLTKGDHESMIEFCESYLRSIRSRYKDFRKD